MKPRSLFLPAVIALASFSTAATAATSIISENFDSYATTAALGAAWTLGNGTLNTASGNPGQSLTHPGGAVTSQTFTAIHPTAAEPIRFSASIYDDGLSANKRLTAGLRSASAVNLIEMGFYNSPSHYSVRTVLFDAAAGGTNWIAFSDIVDDSGASITNVPVAGWHTFTALITDTTVTFTLDLNSDGFINASYSAPAIATAAGFDIVRLGGPSALSSPGGGGQFDNVSLAIVPEPASLGMLALGAVSLLTRRRR